MFNGNLKFKTIWSVVVVLMLLLTPLAVQAKAPTALAPLLTIQDAEAIPGQYIVVYKKNVVFANAEESIRASVTALGGEVQFVYGAALNGYSARLNEQALAAVRADPTVAYVEADAIVSVGPVPDGVNAQATQPVNVGTWGLDRIDQRNLPFSNTYTFFNTGAGVHAYVLDSGIRSTHTQFGARATKDFDAIGGNGGNDCNGHGTHVAGTLGGSTYGVAKGVRIHAVRVLNCAGSGAYSQVIAGVNWVKLNRIRPAVANMSLGGPISTALESALNSMIASGVVLVVAAGNSGNTAQPNACSYSPARLPAAITVGSTYYNDERSYFSNYGACLDIFAPGSYVKSAWYTSNTATNTISGTSMASPHVAGVVALYLQDHPTATQAVVRNYLVNISSKNKVIDAKPGSPNRLLYSRFPGN